MSRILIAATLILAGLAGFSAPAAPVCTVRETVLATMPDTWSDRHVTISPDGTRIGYSGRIERDGAPITVVWVDGKEVAAYDAQSPAWVVFSDNSRHYACAGAVKEFETAMINGAAAAPEYDGCLIAFPDNEGKRLLALVAKGDRQYLLFHGAQSPGYDEVRPSQVTRDRRRLWYSAKTGDVWTLGLWEAGAAPKTWPGRLVGGPVRLSDDQQHWAVTLRRDDDEVVLLDGVQVGGRYEAIDARAIAMSPDGTRVAYAAWRGGKAFVVVDGREYPAYDTQRDAYTPDIVFSRDGKRVAYNVLEKAKPETWAIVVDGTIIARHQTAITPVFGPGRSVAYIGGSGAKERVVIDGRIGPAFASVERLLVSPDGARMAYVACKDASGQRETRGFVPYNSPRTVVVDGAELCIHPLTLTHVQFIAGSRHLLQIAQREETYPADAKPPYGPRMRVFVDATMLDGKYMEIIPDWETRAYIREDGPAAFHFFATKPVPGGEQVVRVDVTIGE